MGAPAFGMTDFASACRSKLAISLCPSFSACWSMVMPPALTLGFPVLDDNEMKRAAK
jgi:hypothetical protein